MKNKLTSLLILSILTTSCVSNSTHEKLLNEKSKIQEDLNSSRTQVSHLEALVAELEQKLGKASSDQKSLKDSIGLMKNALKEASKRKKEVDRRMSEYRKLISRFKKLTDAGELSVKIVDGRMVVVMPSDVLFASGSAKLSQKGQETIKKVSRVLSSIPNKKFQIEGHTDNVPIRSPRFPSNWELASARSTNVVKTMVEAGMNEKRISSASFADSRPLQTNDTQEGKQANRRIEIVVIPDLSLLPGYEELQKLSQQPRPSS